MNAETPLSDLAGFLQTGIEPYHPAWPRTFEVERDRLWRSLTPVGGVVAVKHVGATAVPGLAARPVLDLVVGVTELDAGIERWTEPLLDAGYEREPALDDLIPGTRVLLRAASDPARGFVVFLTDAGSPTWDRFLLFRDHLRHNVERLAPGYTHLRETCLGGQEFDPIAYTRAKQQFVTDLCRQAAANQRAADTGQRFTIRRLTADDLDLAVSLVRRFRRPTSGKSIEGHLQRVLADQKVILLAAVAAEAELPDLARERGPDAAAAGAGDDDVRPGPCPTPIGYALAYELPRIDMEQCLILFHDIEVDPVFRGRGVGKRLTDRMIEVCERRGCSRMIAMTNTSNRVARRLHESSGATQPNREEDVLFVYDFDH